MEDKYTKLKDLLSEYDYPMVYPFKFILKASADKMIQVKRCFDETAEISVRESSKGNFTSITIKQMMLNEDDIIKRYKMLEGVEGLISL